MRIIGGHDYYDCMLAYGRDEQITFVRTAQTVGLSGRSNKDSKSTPEFNFLRRMERDAAFLFNGKRVGIPWRSEWVEVATCFFKYSPIFVVVADTIYYGLRIAVSYEKNPRMFDFVRKWNFVWSSEQLDKLIPGLQALQIIPRSFMNDTKDKDGYFKNIRITDQDVISQLIENNVSVVIGDTYNDSLIINGDGLKNVDFVRHVTPLDCYTALYNWIGGVLSTNANRMVTIADPKILLKKHGMDETSFRKPKRAVK